MLQAVITFVVFLFYFFVIVAALSTVKFILMQLLGSVAVAVSTPILEKVNKNKQMDIDLARELLNQYENDKINQYRKVDEVLSEAEKRWGAK